MKAIKYHAERWEEENYLKLIELNRLLFHYLNIFIKILLGATQLTAYVFYKFILFCFELIKFILLCPPHFREEKVENWIYRHYK